MNINIYHHLSSLPDISKWNTNNIIDISYIFLGCKHLLSLPDISKWNTNNVNNMNSMFDGCVKLSSLPIFPKSLFINNINIIKLLLNI